MEVKRERMERTLSRGGTAEAGGAARVCPRDEGGRVKTGPRGGTQPHCSSVKGERRRSPASRVTTLTGDDEHMVRSRHCAREKSW